MNAAYFNLKLNYSPLSSYDFSIIKVDPIVQKALSNVTLYMLCQRNSLYFDSVLLNTELSELEFNIVQNSNESILKCRMPIEQKNVFTKHDNPITVRFWWSKESHWTQFPPYDKVTGIMFYSGEGYTNFRLLITPDKFIYNYLKGQIDAMIEGNIQKFWQFDVLYVGKAVDQSVVKRLNNHATLQDILSREDSLHDGNLPTYETYLLLFDIEAETIFRQYSPETKGKIISMLKGELPIQNDITTDAEMALINALSPKYNKIFYKNYPKYQTGLSREYFNKIYYAFSDEITLKYQNGEIKGGNSSFRNLLVIDRKKGLIVL